MKILLSAYACEPNKGSEPGVGWNWAIELAKLGHQVHVITRANNKQVITAALEELPRNNLHFIYYDVPKWLTWWKKGGRGVRLYNFFWQIGIYTIAKKNHDKLNFDLVHHITFGVVRQPSFLGKLGIPFIFGPLGGGEYAPYALRNSYPLRGKVLDFIRDVLNHLVKVDPFMLYTFSTASKIYVKTSESKKIIPTRFHEKTSIHLEIGINKDQKDDGHDKSSASGINILYVGRFVYWKGGHLALLAFSILLKEFPGARLTMVGNGPEEKLWRKLSRSHEIDESIDWVPWVSQDKLSLIYSNNDVLLFPSLHDSSGNVVLEGFTHGLPLICLDLGGPGEMVDDTCGYKIKTKGRTESEVVSDLGGRLIELFQTPETLNKLADGAIKRSSKMSWAAIITSIHLNNKVI